MSLTPDPEMLTCSEVAAPEALIQPEPDMLVDMSPALIWLRRPPPEPDTDIPSDLN